MDAEVFSVSRIWALESDVPGVTIFGPDDPRQRGGVVSFDLEGVHPHDLGQVLDEHGVAIRTGHHCAQPVMAALDVPATARASFYLYSPTAEVDALVAAVEAASDFFGGGASAARDSTARDGASA